MKIIPRVSLFLVQKVNTPYVQSKTNTSPQPPQAVAILATHHVIYVLITATPQKAITTQMPLVAHNTQDIAVHQAQTAVSSKVFAILPKEITATKLIVKIKTQDTPAPQVVSQTAVGAKALPKSVLLLLLKKKPASPQNQELS